MRNFELDPQQLTEQIREMAPWHHDIVLFDDFSTGKVFSPDGRLTKDKNGEVSLISPKPKFFRQLKALYPDGMKGARFLDCACNGGGYCFLAREYGCDSATGFDVRKHWIDQARFVQKHRTAGPTDNIDFHVLDLYDVPKQDFPQADFTYFSGIFYHLPDPVTGLKIAADLTKDIILVNTAMILDPNNPRGMTMAKESRTKVMSGVHELSWFPNGQETLVDILRWMGFVDFKVTMFNKNKAIERPGLARRSRIEIVASRQKGRLENLEGETPPL